MAFAVKWGQRQSLRDNPVRCSKQKGGKPNHSLEVQGVQVA